MLWLKSFHIVFVVAWFAGLFYLPRLFIYHRDVRDDEGHARFVTMERRLLGITNIAALLALAFGVALLVWWHAHAPETLRQGWLHAKLALVVLLMGYHHYCGRLTRAFRDRREVPGSTWLRWFNEVPALLLIAIVVLVVVRPF